MTNIFVHIVDDDAALRDALRKLLRIEGFELETYESAEAFLERARTERGQCLIVDLRMPGMSGMDLLSEVMTRGLGLKVILLTAHADVPLAVQATKSGAADILEKPFQAKALVSSILSAKPPRMNSQATSEKHAAARRFSELSVRERDVLDRLVLGLQNKIIAHELGISHRTVEIHRANILKKTGVSSLPELVRVYLAARD
ncbi:response regulator [Rhodoblastus sp.]|uniref:response regulator transcription factor n=1 Tax=Rhodoblastus sp. TaxID=1962975 RepID=UPI00260AC0B9|nr:response regulator [Rhodoblastus sp.]